MKYDLIWSAVTKRLSLIPGTDPDSASSELFQNPPTDVLVAVEVLSSGPRVDHSYHQIGRSRIIGDVDSFLETSNSHGA